MKPSRMDTLDTGEFSRVRENPGGAVLATLNEPQVAPLQGSPRLAGKRVAAVVYSSYPADPRPRRAAEALAREGAHVEVICLKETDEEPQHEIFGKVNITRVPLKRRRGGKLSYVLQYGSFIFLAGSIFPGRAPKRGYDVVQGHNMPDVLVFTSLRPKLLGAKVILD